MTTSETSMQLENIIDGYSLTEVMDNLVSICHEKADHLRSNWQDEHLAREWDKAARAVCTAMSKVHKLGIPQPRKAGAQ